MFIDASTLDAAGTYRLLVGSVIPRPIAWVTSGVAPKPVNLAPFSSFAWVSQHPAMLGFTINRRPTGRKDTVRNIEEDREYVVNIAGEDMLEQLHSSSTWLGPEESEAELLGLELSPSRLVSVPRLARVPISMECVHERTIVFSPTGGEFVVGRVVGWHVSDDVMTGGRIDTELVRPLGRLAGPRYTRLGEITELPPVPGG
ncbi:flavin reductase family protein [Microbacterium sp. SSM24]|uniref:flavin reductase family protein n=1 Tax=Microbacterium sp. SSM24 TaxID=2991714 RepID=UPI00222741D3|nr:flavin reductase family protein [Microbacterium sp. SSM24]MCW3492669.1 flavin reductase family protein [Microbacterium sp. SSM24]